jgi:hypothetical protein
MNSFTNLLWFLIDFKKIKKPLIFTKQKIKYSNLQIFAVTPFAFAASEKKSFVQFSIPLQNCPLVSTI